ncbi:MAG: methyltransferase domain-containing protein, partial [Acidobacteria bacterium]
MLDDSSRRPRNALFDRLAPVWDRLAGGWGLGPVLARVPDPPAGGVAVDLGGATGRLARRLAARGWRVVVVDPSRPMLRRAAGSGLPALAAGGQALPLADASAALVVVVDALHHMPDIPQVIAEIARVLAPGGRAVLLEPDPRSLVGRLVVAGERLLRMESLILPGELLARLFRQTGLEVALDRRALHLRLVAR